MSNWRKAIISTEATVKNAIEVLNTSGIRAALVVDNADRLQGIVTDGDIRRGILSHVDIEDSVIRVMNSQPITCTRNDTKQKILQKMASKGLFHMPIVADDVLVDFVTLHGFSEGKRHGNPVFLMAGGFGTRLRPLTNDMPKPLLRLGNKPILETILENFINAGFHRFFISTHYMPEKIRQYFGDGSKWNVTIEYVHEASPLGTGGALGLLPADLPNVPVVVMNGDILTKVDFEELLEFHNSANGIATVCVTEYQNQIPYGVIETDGEKITEITEKPVTRHFINAGIYVLEPDLVRSVGQNSCLDMPDLLKHQIASAKKVAMFPLHEYWLDIGQMPDFEQAQQDFVSGY